MEMLRTASHLGTKNFEEAREQGGIRVRPGRPGGGESTHPGLPGTVGVLGRGTLSTKTGEVPGKPGGVGHPPGRSH